MKHKNGSSHETKNAPADAKQQDLEKYRVENGPYLTTNQGGIIADNENSLKAGSRGPTLIEDFILREKITHFDHERIPERVVHARGAGAHGIFESYAPIPEYTEAKFLNEPSRKTPVFARFSTVGGSRGSADTARDVRGFAVKFYTDEGVFDIVGNNMPVFFIQDAIKFPDFVHAVKPEQNNEIPQASSAHDTFWDFITQEPEATHMVMWLMSDRAIPRSFRMMEGFGVNTYRFLNADGRSFLIKFHWKPMLGVHSLVWDEAQKLAGKDADFHRRDLWEAIERGEYPEWELGVQLIAEEDQMKFDFDPLDATKLWPEELIPVKRLGKMTLNRNPDNYFAETEQVAFCVSHLVRGIDVSNDPLLQGRLFSYLDTQTSRIGVNFAQLPINRPTAPVSNDQREGKMNMKIPLGPVAYQPSAMKGCPFHSPDAALGFQTFGERIDANKIRQRSESFGDHYSQAALFWNSMSVPEQMHIVDAFTFELSKVMDRDIRKRLVELLSRVDTELATRVAFGLNEKVPAGAKVLAKASQPSPVLSQMNGPKGVMTRKVAILATNGVDGDSLKSLVKAITKAHARAEIISERLGTIETASGEEVEVNKTLLTTASIMFDAVLVPGGQASAMTLLAQGDAIHFLSEAFKHSKAIGAFGHGIGLLRRADLGGIQPITGAGVSNQQGVVQMESGDIAAFAAEFLAVMSNHRYWDRAKDLIPA